MSAAVLSSQVFADAAAVALAAADFIAARAQDAIAERGRFRVVLAGGRTPEATYRHLRERDLQWSDWEIFFGDERCLPADHPERNSQMVAAALTRHVAIPRGQIHAIPAELGAARAAARYAEDIGAQGFDLVVHGLGEDGHTASLFPHHAVDPQARVIAVHDAPKWPAERVSLGLAALRDTAIALAIVTGTGKTQALKGWLDGDSGLPIARVCQGVNCVVFTELAAAARDTGTPGD